MNKELISVLKAILATIIYVVGINLIGFWSLLAKASGLHSLSALYGLIQGILICIAALIFMYFVRSRSFKNILKEAHNKWYLFALLLGISFVFFQSPLNWMYNIFFEPEYTIAYRFDGLYKFKNINLLSSVLFIPIAEELIFRGYIQDFLQRKTNVVVAIVVASLLFASIHAPVPSLILDSFKYVDDSVLALLIHDWHLFYITLFGGAISGLLYYKSKSVGPSIVFHMFWNIMVTFI